MALDSLEKLAGYFKTLPGVGYKTAMRYAYSILNIDKNLVKEFAHSLIDVKENIHFCSECGYYTEDETCSICMRRKKDVVCVVKDPKDVMAFEKMGAFDGVYHCLHGTIDFQKNITVEDIRVKELVARLTDVKEVIIALDADISGEMTSTYLANLIKPLGIKVSKIAHGIPMGSEIEYADEVTLQKALSERREM